MRRRRRENKNEEEKEKQNEEVEEGNNECRIAKVLYQQMEVILDN